HGLGLGVGEAALQLLLHAVQVGDATSRILAARTLGQIGRPEHLPALQALNEEQDPAVQQAAMQAIQQIESRYRGIPEPPAPAPEGTELTQP
ncbi:MAG TPA: HEAT repeat domain-containing protein, partial [Anaerolineae bacterium]|nr:HEAT repeat domain-containing protein [Anaerolineae bacterium]